MIALAALLLAGCLHPAADADLVHQLDREVLALRERNRLLEEQAADCGQGGPPPPIYPELVQVFRDTEVRVAREGQRVAVTIPGGLLFAPGGTTVREEAGMVLDLLATALQLHPDQHVWVVGHTDGEPLSGSLRRRYGTNWELSAARAAAFMHALVEEHGIAEDRFTIAGLGATRPVADNDTPEGRAQNRRIVVVIGPPEDWR